MAKKIKVIQCPQCGSTKPEQTRTDHYRCNKCGTEFFLDSDDINININHNTPPPRSRTQTNTTGNGKGLCFFISVFTLLAIIFLAQYCVNIIRNADNTIIYKTYESVTTPRDKYLYSMLLPAKGESVVFYLENKGAKDSTFAVFRNPVSAEILSEQNIGKFTRKPSVDHRFFVSDSSYYLIINQSRIYRIDPDNYSLKDITEAICLRKPALEAGLMQVAFVEEGTGEGFRMNTNLGKELFYFPAEDVLCTENAFKFMATDDKGILPGAKNRIYYLFLNKESSHSSNVAELMEITYRFNNGGPENRLQEITGGRISNPGQHRIISSKAITEERVCFSPEILYSDNNNILISFRPTLVRDEVVHVQLLDHSGEIMWTTSFTSDFKCIHTVRTQKGFMLQISENNFWEISPGGENVKNYNF